MAGGSISQSSQAVTRGGRGSVAAGGPSSGLRQRRPAGRSAGSRGLGQSFIPFHTDDSPGFKIPPVWVIVMSLGFILFVTVLHIIGKLRG